MLANRKCSMVTLLNLTPVLQLSFTLLGFASSLLWITPAIALVVLRRGFFGRSVAIAALGC